MTRSGLFFELSTFEHKVSFGAVADTSLAPEIHSPKLFFLFKFEFPPHQRVTSLKINCKSKEFPLTIKRTLDGKLKKKPEGRRYWNQQGQMLASGRPNSVPACHYKVNQ